MRFAVFFSLLIYSVLSFGVNSNNIELKSPDNNMLVAIRIADKITYTVNYRSEVILLPSTISMKLKNGLIPGNYPKLKNSRKQTVNHIIYPEVRQKGTKINDVYNELELVFKGNYSIIFRAYNDGIAYRFKTAFPNDITVYDEESVYQFPSNDTVYFAQVNRDAKPGQDCFHTSFEEAYKILPISEITAGKMAYSPIIVCMDNLKIAITESDLTDYPGMFITGTNDGTYTLKGKFAPYPVEEKSVDFYSVVSERADYIAKTRGSRSFPWRILIIAPKDGDLIENDMVFRLAGESQLDNLTWLKPGKSTSEWLFDNNIYGVDFKSGYNTDTYKYYIDFAAKFKLEYVLFDAGWSSWTNLFELTPEMDMEYLTSYAKGKGVGLVLWTSAYALSRQMDAALDKFKAWGIKGIMVDFIDRDDQKMIAFFEKAAKETAKRQLFVDFHGCPKPAGLNRRFPNVLTMEGAMVQEYYKFGDKLSPEHELCIPFIRGLAGPLDYEPGNMKNETRENFKPMSNKPTSLGTRIHQMAMFLVYESPYAKMGGNPSDYLKEPEFTQFIVNIPTVWDETKVIDAKLGDYVVILRQAASGDYYLGAMNDWTPQEFTVDCSFLKEGAFEIEIYKDGMNAGRYASDYKHEILTINNTSSLKIQLTPGGGWVGKIRKL
ncbi:MAG: glycoside hydrolase family 97 protein [Mangrovibacterium sp.]